jgi:hypothetical protein
MSGKGTEAQKAPPYVAYKTLINLLDRFKQGVPGRIDRSVMTSFSFAVQGQLLACLHFLKLIDKDDNPTDKLFELVNSEEERKKTVWEQVLADAYPFIFSSGHDLKTITPRLLEEAFTKAGTQGNTTKKCIRFFIPAAKSAGLELSPYLKTPKARAATRRAKKPTIKNNDTKEQLKDEKPSDKGKDSGTAEKDWDKMLLEKLPPFDPTWPAEAITKWMAVYEKLIEKKVK